MSTYILTHGAWHGAWCWYKTAPLLEEQGHEVITFDLPAHGVDETPMHGLKLDEQVQRLCEILDRRNDTDPVIVVGHSSGGAVITQAAEARPETVDTLIYLTAFLPPNGASVMDVAQADADSLVLRNLIPDQQAGRATVREEAVRDAFYHDCPESDVRLAQALLRAEPLGSLSVPVRTTDERFGTVRRVYIECLDDKAITPAMQARMYGDMPCERVLSLDTSHSPFLSNPEALVDRLVSL